MNSKMTNWIIAIGLAALLFSACRDETFYSGTDAMITSSLDTLTFDTVFTEVGTTTKFFKIYNQEEATIVIDEIALQDLTGHFRLNVDGTAGNVAKNVQIAANDSIYVFVEATINPDLPLESSPYVLEDIVDITIDDKTSIVRLIAWGQDANYVTGHGSVSQIAFATPSSVGTDTWVWDDPKPYVIYGTLVIDSLSVILPAGTEVFVHGGVAINDVLGVYTSGLIFLLPNANIISQGTAEEPVTILSDRLEEDYEDVKGQWFGIYLSGSRQNEFHHTTISNALVGVRADSASSVSFYESEISHTSASGLIGSHSEIYAQNTLIHNTGGASIGADNGGTYEFYNCTFVNYDNQDEAIQMANYKCQNESCSVFTESDLDATFVNCLVVGNDSDEIIFDSAENQADFNYSFENCFVQVDEFLLDPDYSDFFNNCINCLNNPPKDTLFINMDEYDFRLDTFSMPIDAGMNIPFILTEDILGNPRDDNYDIGCYEFIF